MPVETSVAAAVSTSLQSGRPLLVIVTDTPIETSPQTAFARLPWASSGLSELVDMCTVPLEIIASSQEHGYFAQLFAVQEVPSIHIIWQATVIDVVTERDIAQTDHNDNSDNESGNSSADDQSAAAKFESRLRKALATLRDVEQHPQSAPGPVPGPGPDTRSGSGPATTTDSTPDQTSTAANVTSGPTSATSATSNPAPSSVAPSSVAPSSVAPGPSSSRAASGPETGPKTSGSSQNGPGLTPAGAQARYQQQLRDQRRVESEERRRILKLVETDKKERQSQSHSQSSTASSPSASSDNPQSSSTSSTPTPSRSPTNECALSVRLFDGSALKHRFPATDTLDQVRNWVDATQSDGDRPYSFFQPTHRRLFRTLEEAQTLRELDLTPSATLVLKPVTNYSTAYADAAGGPSAWLHRGTQAIGDALYTFLGLGYDPHSPQSSASSSEASTRASSPQPDNAPRPRRPSDRSEDRTTYNGNQLSLEDDKKKSD